MPLFGFQLLLPVEKIFGVGKVMGAKLHKLNIKTCADIEQLSLHFLLEKFGKFGYRLYNYSRGIDEMPVEPNRHRRSASVEMTFLNDTQDLEYIINSLKELHSRLLERLKNIDPKYRIKGQYLKIKYSDHQPRSIMQGSQTADVDIFINMLNKLKLSDPIRLLGIGVRFYPDNYAEKSHQQLSLFNPLSYF
jgi:DNA polymerase-4